MASKGTRYNEERLIRILKIWRQEGLPIATPESGKKTFRRLDWQAAACQPPE